jgi:hypothetical protein
MSRALNLSRPVRCARDGCEEKFVRNHGGQKLCDRCRPNKVKARIAAGKGRPPAVQVAVPARLPVQPGPRREDRERSVRLALRLARQASEEREDLELREHARRLVEYAQKVAAGEIPDRTWQIAKLGFAIAPCNGTAADGGR